MSLTTLRVVVFVTATLLCVFDLTTEHVVAAYANSEDLFTNEADDGEDTVFTMEGAADGVFNIEGGIDAGVD